MSKLSKKTVLITGATGLIGSHIVDALMAMKDVKVIALSRSKRKLSEGFKEYIDNPNFIFIARDVSDELNINSPVDFIFHAAGPMEGKIIRDYPLDVINPNLIGTMNCLELLKRQKEKNGITGRMILFSSVTVYGNNTDHDVIAMENNTSITENLNSRSSPYSQSKRMSEVIALAYAKQFGIDVVIARFSTVYGATRFIPDTAFFEFIRKAVAGEDIILNSVGLPRRDNIYVDDAVAGVLTIAERGLSCEAYNISSNGDLGNYASVDEIAELIANNANSINKQKVNVKFKISENVDRQPGLRLDNNKLKNLDWRIENSLKNGIEKTIKNLM